MTLLYVCLQNLNFWERNEGAFLGTIGAGLVAIIAAYLSSYLTNKKAIEKDLKEEANRYSGFLSLIHTELNAHKSHLQLLINSLQGIKELSIENETFIIDNLPMKFDLSLIDEGLNQLCQFQNFDHRIMIFLISYKNLINGANIALEFDRGNELLSKQKDLENKRQLIESYFNVLDAEYLNKIEPLISDIRKLIEKNINKADMLIFRELNGKKTAPNK